MNTTLSRLASAIGLVMVFAFGCACGQDLHAAQACTRLGDDAARLSCYDAAMGRQAGPTAAKAHPAERVASGSANEQPTAATGPDGQAKFGDDGRFHTEAKPTLPKSLSAQVRDITPLPAGLYQLTLDNGQVWDTTEADSALVLKANDAVVISRRLLGGYLISVAGHNVSVGALRKQ